MRLHWFLPALRRDTPPRGRMLTVLRRFVPAAWLSDGTTKRRGLVRRLLRVAGPSWLASPARRLTQTFSLLLFLMLLVYVCWPYTARPARSWSDWLPVSVDAESGQVVVASDDAQAALRTGQILHISDHGGGKAEPGIYLGEFQVQSAAPTGWELVPRRPLSAEDTDVLATSFGPWTLSETPPDRWPAHYAEDLQRKERISAELFLAIDPLVSLSTAVAARAWVWSLTAAGIILTASLLIPRGFCGYLCPLGTTIDLFDWAFSRRLSRFHLSENGWWVHVKYYLLGGILVAALCGVLTSGYFAAIPVITRAAVFAIAPLELGLLRGWHQVPPLNAGHFFSLTLFVLVLGLGLLQPRFWCKYICPSGALFSLGNLFRVTQRKVESSCIHCNKCVQICPFDAIKADFNTRTLDCTFCQTCGGVCPVHSIKFVERWNLVDLKAENDPPVRESRLGRRGFLSSAIGLVSGGVLGWGYARAAGPSHRHAVSAGAIVRPPGSVPEAEFLNLCIRCGECFQACPNSVLQPLGFQQGLAALWTPQVVADWSGCEPSCNNCGQVCPTGAIRALPLEEKRVARLALAEVSQRTCLPFAGREACQLCVDECQAAGYKALEFMRVGTTLDPFEQPIEDSGFLAPVVLADKCVGCGLCQTRCYKVNVVSKRLLPESAIVIRAGEGNEDRLRSGSYRARREEEQRQRLSGQRAVLEQNGGAESYLPDFLSAPPAGSDQLK